MNRVLLLIALCLLVIEPAYAKYHYQQDFSAQDFQTRRAVIYDAIGSDFALIQGAEEVQCFIIFRQSNTFYYLSGLESPSAYLMLDGKKRETILYLPHRDEERERVEGQTLAYEDSELIKKITGVEQVRPIEKMATDFTNRYLRPGVTADQVLDEAAADMRKVFDKMTFSKAIYRQACEKALSFRGHIQHPVGMTVHDVGNFKTQPFKVGQVFSIDPMIWIPEEQQYIRMEDVVVITKDGVENLSASLPLEMDELEKIMAEVGIVQKLPAVF